MKLETFTSKGPQPIANYTEAIRAGDLVFAAGQTANDLVDGIPPEATVNPAFPFYGSEIKRQTRYILENLKKTFEAAHMSLANVVKAQVFLRDMKDFNGFDEVWKEYFGDYLPPRTTVGTTGLLASGDAQLLEIDLIAHTNDTTKRVVTSDNPQPIANYSEAVVVGNLVFPAGQVASDFKTGVPPEARTNPAYPFYGSDIKLQTDYILRNLTKTLEAAGSSLHNTVKAQVFLRDLRDFNGFDEVWKEHFGDEVPPRTTVSADLLVPDALVEIDLIAHTTDTRKRAVTTDNPQPIANYSEAVVVDNIVFPAGQVATDFSPAGVPPEARTNPAFPYYGSDIKLQTDYILRNLTKTLEAAGSSLRHVAKAQVFLCDLHDFNGFDEVWKEHFGECLPARTTIESGLLPRDTLVEIDLIGAVAD